MSEFKEKLALLQSPMLNFVAKNQLALELSQTGDKQVLAVLHTLIKNKNYENHRGTFVYCLQNFPVELSFELAINLVMSGNFEVAHEAFLLLEKVEYITGVEVKGAYHQLEIYKNNTLNIEEWRDKLITEILEWFE